MKTDSPIILTGRGGSGTRMLSDAVRSMGVFLGNRRNGSGDSLEWTDLLYEMALECIASPDTSEAIADRWRDRLHARARDVLERGGRDGERPWGWKLPETMFAIAPLMAAFPGARLIHQVRHPVTSSLRRTHKTSRMDSEIGVAVIEAAYADAGLPVGDRTNRNAIADNAVTWRFQVSRAAAACAALGSRTTVIRYEDLCADHTRAQHDVAAFLGLMPPLAGGNPVDPARTGRGVGAEANCVWALCADVAHPFGYEFTEDGTRIIPLA